MIDFSDKQKRMVATGLTILSLIVVFTFVSFLAWGVVSALAFLSGAIVPVVVGFFLSLFFKPYYRWWVRTVKNPTAALIMMLATVFIPLGFLAWYAGAVAIDQVSNLVSQTPVLVKEVSAWFQATFPRFHNLLTSLGFQGDGLSDLYAKYGSTALKASAGALKCLIGVVSLLVTLIFFIFFLMTKDRKGSDIVAQFTFLKDDTRAFVAEQIDTFVDILVSFFQRQVVICLIEGVMYGTGFWLVGLPYGFLIGFALGVINLIPFFGSLICLPVALPLAYFGNCGSLTRLVLVLVVWGLGQLLDGYFITPKIQGNKTGLGYAGVIFSFFFWSTVLGPLLGMLLAIPLSAFCVVLWRALKARYIKPVV